jgi:hypothetical protein
VTAVDLIAGSMRWSLGFFGRPQQYLLNDGATTASLTMWLRGVREADLFAGAMQQDQAAVLDALQFRTAFPGRVSPQRLDRIRVAGISFAVEEWRGSPNDDAPVFFKLLLRGGSQ